MPRRAVGPNPAVGPKLRIVLYILFGLVGVLGANSVYLAAITFLEWRTGATYQEYFYQWMFLIHLILGLLLILPFIVFTVIHFANTKHRKNKRAIRVGYLLLGISVAVLISGLLLSRMIGIDLKRLAARNVVYWLHVISPLVAVWLYWLHRLVGPKIRWRLGFGYAVFVGLVVTGMVWMHTQDPRQWNVAGPKEGEKYFFPSAARTATGNFIPASTLMMNDYCQRCHPDAHAQWSDSVHRFSSFNNAAYLASVIETRKVSLDRDGTVQASRWCAGCHDPVPFFSGAFDDPQFDVVNHMTAQAGISCTVCHSITHVNSTKGNADYTIEEPIHYPFATSDHAVLQWINNQLVKAKPAMHKKTFLKDFHKSAEFCSTCHKVSLPYELNHYKQFLRGQNHYDPYLLSGVSGHGARSFYYPPKAKENCSVCHMPLKGSQDFGAKLFADAKELSIHDHLFPSANTAIAWLRDRPEIVKAHQDFLKDVMRIDIFGIKEGGTIDGTLHAPLRPEVPPLVPGKKYLLETVIRTVKMGHLFTQGTVDSNEIWVDVTVTSGDRIIGRSGGMNEIGEVDPWSHFVNVFMLDRNGNRIDRRNPQDIFTPLYNHQIPPGAGQVVHFGLDVPDNIDRPISVSVKLQYRKFDQRYMDFVSKNLPEGFPPFKGYRKGEPYHNMLPVTTLAADEITFPVEGIEENTTNETPKPPAWERWNDYGIGLFLEGKAELRQAAAAFLEVEKLGRYDGPLNLARVYHREGQLDEAVAAITRAAKYTDPAAPPWTIAWLSGLVNREQGHLETAEKNFRSVLTEPTQEMLDRGFDFRPDYEIQNLLGQTLFDRARQFGRMGSNKEGEAGVQQRNVLLQQAIDVFHETLKYDVENVTAHYNLHLLYTLLDRPEKAAEHQKLHSIYKADDNAQGEAVRLAREKYPAANHAAEPLVIYPLHRTDAPGLPAATEKVTKN
ncbi:MAG: multiheme c-type cytochrome [Planctomycetota bacterium]|nr:multiheme c-type cytochrome [Planctomycetota bacterium]MDA1212521.1 multiheme c-type cytochrome [Planctomycetota bacterium]